MADYEDVQSPKNIGRNSFSWSFSSSKMFSSLSETEFVTSSPTSILDSKPFTGLKSPFCSDNNIPQSPKPVSKNLQEKFDSGKVGLGLVDDLVDEKSDINLSKLDNRVVVGSQLKIQVPSLFPVVQSTVDSPKSPGDFGIKTRNSCVGSLSSSVRKSPFSSSESGVFRSLTASEMELSEDYTCVISYGPNPRTTHIFDDCIVESCCGIVKFSELRKENEYCPNQQMSYPSESFLSFCHNCKKNIGQEKDIYMYRGEKAFCSSDCRYREMMLDEEGAETSESDYSGTSS